MGSPGRSLLLSRKPLCRVDREESCSPTMSLGIGREVLGWVFSTSFRRGVYLLECEERRGKYGEESLMSMVGVGRWMLKRDAGVSWRARRRLRERVFKRELDAVKPLYNESSSESVDHQV